MILPVTPRILKIKADHQLRTDSHIPDAWKTEQHLPDPTQRGQGNYGEGSQTSLSLASYVSQPSIGESIVWGTNDRVSVQPHTCFSRWWTVWSKEPWSYASGMS